MDQTPNTYAQEHLNSLADEIGAITKHLAADPTVPREMVGERVLKVALAMLQRPRPEAGEVDPILWQAMNSVRSVLVEARECSGFEGPMQVEAALRRYLTKLENDQGLGVQFEKLRSDLVELELVAQGCTRAQVVEAALKLTRDQAQRIQEHQDEDNERNEAVRSAEQECQDLRAERDCLVELLNAVLTPTTSGTARMNEAAAIKWLKVKGWLTAPEV